MKKGYAFSAIGLSVLSGLMLILSWPEWSFTIALLFAWVPLLSVIEQHPPAFKLIRYPAIALLVWNTGTTWWLWNSTGFGAVAAIIINTCLMCLPWWGYISLRKQWGRWPSLMGLVAFWLCFEWVHLNWSISWPWLTLGNGLSPMAPMIQWYEFTGVAGGSLLIWIMNILGFKILLAQQKKQARLVAVYSAAIFLLWIFVGWMSYLSQWNPGKETTKENIVVVQPNIDPYQKFESLTTAQQIEKLVRISKTNIDSNTSMLVWPETAMSAADWQDNIPANAYYQPVFQLLNQYPKLQLVSGIETFKRYGTTAATSTARKTEEGIYYDAFNAAIQLQAKKDSQSMVAIQEPVFYNKSKLVPGVETLPSFLRFMAPVFEQFGGSTGGYGVSDTPVVFRHPLYQQNAAPIICYESVYGEYVANYVKRGANLLTIMTNDGWWGNTDGHKQHLQYAKLRAIETRRWVARSANTGISAFIDPTGKIVQQLGWDQAGALQQSVYTNNEQSFYVQHGDYIFKIAVACSVFLLLISLRKRSKNVRKNQSA